MFKWMFLRGVRNNYDKENQIKNVYVEGFIDIVASRSNSVYYKKIPKPGKIFIVSMVTNPGAGEKIREFLFEKNYYEGVDFMLMG